MAIKQADTGVRAASDRFYKALGQMASGDADSMEEIWSHREDVTTMHPIGGREVGWEAVKEPWKAVAGLAEKGEVTRTDQFIRVMGDVAYELTTEEVSMTLGGETLDSAYRATNIYCLEDGEWKIVHHHADLDPKFIELLQRLEGAA
ncbi:nuclear transport factor 2 family protein [Haladaptatus sp. DJG-WS-42]|uniref:YybH family protein n=1 Tax=Haladaptatus sp. DJG-WS-42 TaxID=3120516 RepID=UPI0030D59594